MSGTSTVRDVSAVRLPSNVKWSDAEFDRCPHCGRLTPAPMITVFGKLRRFVPYPCDCQEAASSRDRYQSGIDRALARQKPTVPERYADVISGLDADDYAESVKDGCGLYFWGRQGRGKTAMAYAICDRMRSRGWTAEVVKMESVMAEISATFSSSDTEADIMSRLTRCGLLVLDDLGSERTTEATVAKLLRIVDERCEAKRPTVVTSNYAIPDLGKHYAQANPTSARSIASRLSQMTVPIEVTGEDRRLA